MKGWMFLFILFVIPSVLGLGVAQDYLEEDTLRLLKGETHYLKIILQNPESEDLSVRLEVKGEAAVIHDPQEFYNLSAKSYDNIVYLKVTTPEGARVGDKYEVSYSLLPHREQEGGMIGMNLKITRKFYVLMVNEEGVSSNKNEVFGETDSDMIIRIAITVLVIVFLIIVGTLIARKSSHISNKMTVWWRSKRKKKSEKTEITKRFPPIKNEKIVKRPSINTAFIEKASSTKLYFHLKSGTTLRSVLDLYHYLHIMPHGEFSHHVNGRENDFAKWVEGVFSLNLLARKMRKSKTREDMRKIIKYEMDK